MDDRTAAGRRPAPALTCAIAGYGVMGRMHRAKLAELGVRTVAVVDPRAAGRVLPCGARVVATLDQVPDPRAVDLWSICVPTVAHAPVFRRISRLAPEADVIIEKPVCAPSALPGMARLLADHHGRVAVDEHYGASIVLAEVARVLSARALTVTRVAVEMTKHRGRDADGGRFEDRALGALGYEGPHLLGVLDALGQRLGVPLRPGGPVAASFHGTWGADGAAPQEGAEVRYRTAAGCDVVLYTSLVGRPRRQAPGPRAIAYGSDLRHRVIEVEAVDRRGRRRLVTGAFEPVAGRLRNEGTVAVLRDGHPLGPTRTVHDDPLGRHLGRILRYFDGRAANPAPAGQGIDHVALLDAWVRAARPEPIRAARTAA
ncbi:Gfo/Idh/MocA family oxidoreductase [Streptomyces sp. NPDC001568]|uniref:Gfo/Idh/MocA family oxidoreductase n=1 Tax=Streptomyces sp. NPDC001568 TaxID=3364588 RepID=UPI0036CE82BA